VSGSGKFHQTLTSYAQTYLSLGWSIIPLHTDSERAKIPAVAWKRYQRQRADDIDARRWFEVQGHTGLGIVTGSISRLIVIDFDDSSAQKAFLRENPQLADTWTIQSRRGWHLYFRTQPHQRIASRKLPGIDLLAEGRYVVAPPTTLNGHDYAKINGGGLPKLLSDLDIVQLIRNFENHTPPPNDAMPISVAADAQKHVPTNSTRSVGIRHRRVREMNQPTRISATNPSVSTQPDRSASILASIQDMNQLIQPDAAARPAIDDLARIYRSLVPQNQRNTALFKTACLARDCGFDSESVIAALAGAHSIEPPAGKHHLESPQRRHREAIRTIHSAFSRPPKPVKQTKALNLCNSIREALFTMKQTCTARTLEGLRLHGVRPGMIFSRQQAVELLSGIVGRDSVDAALNAVTPGGKFVFERKNPSPRPSPPVRTASFAKRDQQKNAFCSQTKSGKIESGRKQHHFVMPSNHQLCQILEVDGSVIDPLTLDDLRSAKATRQAAHREKIKRAPGRYSVRLLSGRLGVSPMTLRRYNRQIDDLHVAPTFTSKPVTWGTLNVLPPEAWIEPGMFLEDERGRRYKPLLGVARKLLASGRQLRYMAQGWNTASGGMAGAGAAGTRKRTEIGQSGGWNQAHGAAYSGRRIRIDRRAETSRYRETRHPNAASIRVTGSSAQERQAAELSPSLARLNGRTTRVAGV